MQFSGEIFQGNIEGEDFLLQKVKHLDTASTLSKQQVERLFQYLDAQEDSCTLTVNDQIPVLLKQEEIQYLQQDLLGILRTFE